MKQKIIKLTHDIWLSKCHEENNPIEPKGHSKAYLSGLTDMLMLMEMQQMTMGISGAAAKLQSIFSLRKVMLTLVRKI